MGRERKEGRKTGREFGRNTVKQNLHEFEYMMAHWVKSKDNKMSQY